MRYLKQSTASQTRTIGPFLDDTDFKTAEEGLTVNASDIRLKKNGANDVAKNSGGATHDVNGCYHLTFDATDTDTVGELFYTVKISGALQVFGAFFVLEEAVYDALFAASAPGYGTAQTGDSFARLGAPAGASVSADIAAIEAQTDDIGTAGAGLTAIPWNAAWDAEVQSEAADALNAYDPPTNAEMEARTLAAASYATAAALSTVSTNVAAILDDTGTSGVVLSSATCNKIADHVRRRTQANVEASSDGDALSLGSAYGIDQMHVESNTTANPGFITVFRTDGVTELGQKAITTDAGADPITGIS